MKFNELKVLYCYNKNLFKVSMDHSNDIDITLKVCLAIYCLNKTNWVKQIFF